MLTQAKLKTIKPLAKIARHHDQHGLYLQVMPNGSKYWRLKYHIRNGDKRVEKTLALGVYPEVSLKSARENQILARQQIRQGIDPSLAKRKERLTREHARANQVLTLARKWFDAKLPQWSQSHRQRQERLLFVDLKPLHQLPLTELNPALIMAPLNIMIDRGAIESARRALGALHQVLDYGCSLGLLDHNVATPIKSALPKSTPQHYGAPTTPQDYHAVIELIWQGAGDSIVDIALKLCPLMLVRPGELRQMRWEQIGQDDIWRIPHPEMKRRRDHWVALSKQAKILIQQARLHNSNREYVFASPIKPKQAISSNAILQRMRRLGIPKDMGTPHGFRASGRTLLDEELTFRKDWIEHQLAHKVREPDGRAYNRTEFLRDRKKMMQKWSDYSLQYVAPNLAANSSVVKIGRARS